MKLHLMTLAVPRNSHAVPCNSHAVPRNSHAVPRNSHAVPCNSHAVPRNFHAVPRNSHAVPRNSHAVPRNCHAVPRNSHAVPRNSHDNMPLILPVLLSFDLYIIFSDYLFLVTTPDLTYTFIKGNKFHNAENQIIITLYITCNDRSVKKETPQPHNIDYL